MKKSTLVITLLGAAAAFLPLKTALAQSVNIFNNLAYATNAGADVYLNGGSGLLADSFSTLSSSSTLTQVSLLLSSDAVSPAGNATIGLYADSSTSPGALLSVLGMVDDGMLPTDGTYAQYDFTSTFSLAASTRYWIGITAPNADSVSWSSANNASGVGTTGEYFFFNHGSSYPNSEGPWGMSVSVTAAVPEPSTYALFGLGGLALMIAVRRRVLS